jgi:hypothetical protein
MVVCALLLICLTHLQCCGSGSDFFQVTVPVPAPVLASYLDHKKHSFQKFVLEKFLPFYILSCLQGKNL